MTEYVVRAPRNEYAERAARICAAMKLLNDNKGKWRNLHSGRSAAAVQMLCICVLKRREVKRRGIENSSRAHIAALARLPLLNIQRSPYRAHLMTQDQPESQGGEGFERVGFARVPEVERFTGFSISKVRVMAKRGEFPKPKKLPGSNIIVWDRRDLWRWYLSPEAWIESARKNSGAVAGRLLEAMADRLRSGENLHAVLDEYGLELKRK